MTVDPNILHRQRIVTRDLLAASDTGIRDVERVILMNQVVILGALELLLRTPEGKGGRTWHDAAEMVLAFYDAQGTNLLGLASKMRARAMLADAEGAR